MSKVNCWVFVMFKYHRQLTLQLYVFLDIYYFYYPDSLMQLLSVQRDINLKNIMRSLMFVLLGISLKVQHTKVINLNHIVQKFCKWYLIYN